jgi:hypothetical protein
MRRLTAASAVAGIFLALAALPVRATADTTLPFGNTFGDLVLDEPHGHLFLARGAGKPLLMSNLDGTGLTQVAGAAGVGRLLLSQDSSTLYAVQSDTQRILEIDTTSLASTSVPTRATTTPYDIAEASGLIVFSYGDSNEYGTNLGVLDPATNTLTYHLLPDWTWYGVLDLESEPALPGKVVAGELGGSALKVYDVSAGPTPAVTKAAETTVGLGAELRDLTLTPDGGRVYVAATGGHGGYRWQVFSSADLAEQSPYSSFDFPTSVAVRADGLFAGGQGSQSRTITLFKPGSHTMWRTYYWPGNYNDSNQLVERSLVFGTERLYAVTSDIYGRHQVLRVITPRNATHLSITPSVGTTGYNRTVSLSVHLDSASPVREVAVFATPLGGARRLVARGHVDADGNFNAQSTVKRLTAFTVVFAGDADNDPGSVTTTVKVRAGVRTTMIGTRRHIGNYAIYRAGQRAVSRALVQPNHAGQCVFFEAEYTEIAGGNWRTLGSTKCVRLDTRSRGTAFLDTNANYRGIRVRFRAIWHGDDANLKSRSNWAYARFVR